MYQGFLHAIDTSGYNRFVTLFDEGHVNPFAWPVMELQGISGFLDGSVSSLMWGDFKPDTIYT